MKRAEDVRLGRRVREERMRRWRRREDFAAECRLSTTVLDELENGRRSNFSAETLGAVEDALDWMPGSAELVRRGGDPVYREDPEWSELRAMWPRLPLRERKRTVQFVRSALD